MNRGRASDGAGRDREMARVSAAARADDLHSPLFRWMEKRHDWMAADIAEHGAHWAARCREWAALPVPVLDGKGRAPEAGVAKETWRRVVKHVEDRRKRAAAREAARVRPVPPLRPGESVPGVRVLAGTSPEPSRPVPAAVPPSFPPTAVAPADDPLAHIRARMAARSK